eukprot:c9206_g1_i1.p1 GENE.c9206_g1_i1~~c9206_g1_i1.p1  ORF type:complete len:473 (+),score=120.26 c9206_g1_i1:37-1419(+)
MSTLKWISVFLIVLLVTDDVVGDLNSQKSINLLNLIATRVDEVRGGKSVTNLFHSLELPAHLISEEIEHTLQAVAGATVDSSQVESALQKSTTFVVKYRPQIDSIIDCVMMNFTRFASCPYEPLVLGLLHNATAEFTELSAFHPATGHGGTRPGPVEISKKFGVFTATINMFFWLTVFCYAVRSAMSMSLMDRFREAFDMNAGVIAESRKKGEEMERQRWEIIFEIFPSYETFLRAQGTLTQNQQKEIMTRLCGAENVEDPSKCWKKNINSRSQVSFLDLSIWNGEIMIPLLAIMLLFGSQISLNSCELPAQPFAECSFGRSPGSICMTGCFAKPNVNSHKQHSSFDVSMCSRYGTWVGSMDCKYSMPVTGCYSDGVPGIRLNTQLISDLIPRYEDAVDACDRYESCSGIGMTAAGYRLYKRNTSSNMMIRDPTSTFYFKGGCANAIRRYRNDGKSMSPS